jgi:glycosyltransferase involved in cell wall biosynthesis
MTTHTVLASDFRTYATTIRACRIAQTCEMECRFGALRFDFSHLGQVEKCIVYARRKSGNGYVVATSGSNLVEINILSKTLQYFDMNLSDSVLEIKRPVRSTGTIEIVKIELHSGSEMVSKWHEILARCKEHKCVRVSNGRLFASEGAVITAESINAVETNPPNMCSIQGQSIRFAGSCEILNLDVSGQPRNTNIDYYPHIEGVVPLSSVLPDVEAAKTPVVTSPVRPAPTPPDKPSHVILYDSNANGNFAGIKQSGAVTVSGKVVNLEHTGSITIPISSIAPNETYSVSVETQTVNGNGKFLVTADPSKNGPTLIFSTPQRKIHTLTVVSGEAATGFNLMVSRPTSATGRIIVSRIMVMAHSSVHVTRMPIQAPPPAPSPPSPAPYTPMTGITLNDRLMPIPVAANVQITSDTDRRFVIVIPSYNNERWVERNIVSAITQNYPRFRVIFIDDCSKDNTFVLAEATAKRYPNADITLVRNPTRIGALANLYNAIHSCADDEIVLTLDGDDWLYNENVLTYLNNTYRSGNVWLTYGQYTNHPDGGNGISQSIPQHIIDRNGYRQFTWCASHLRTFYAWLFKKIARHDLLMTDGTFFPMTWDFAIMFPMLEMAGSHSQFIRDFLYVYNLENPINDHKVNRKLQADLDRLIRNKAKYSPVTISVVPRAQKTKIGLMIIATNKYRSFLPGIIASADKFFFNENDYEITYYIFSDNVEQLTSNRNIVHIHIDHRPFPFASMDRFRHFTNYKRLLNNNDYLYYIDVDSVFVNHVGPEVLGTLVGVRHCGYYNGGGSFETNEKSVFYLPRSQYKYYFGGGFSGGKAADYLTMSQWCADKIEEDLSNNIMPVWHDETALNRYFATTPPDKVLSPSYHYPQGNLAFFKARWNRETFEPKIMLLDKQHSHIRK